VACQLAYVVSVQEPLNPPPWPNV